MGGLKANANVLANKSVGDAEAIDGRSELQARGRVEVGRDEVAKSIAVRFADENGGDGSIVGELHRDQVAGGGVVKDDGEGCASARRASDFVAEKAVAALDQSGFAMQIECDVAIGLTDIDQRQRG